MVDGDVQPSANQRRQRVGGAGGGAGVGGKGRVEAVYDANQTLGKRRIAGKSDGCGK
jgi:hypothetical protein